jgi:hypothetical protein
MISVNVPQRQYAWQVEQCLSFAQKSVRIIYDTGADALDIHLSV